MKVLTNLKTPKWAQQLIYAPTLCNVSYDIWYMESGVMGRQVAVTD